MIETLAAGLVFLARDRMTPTLQALGVNLSGTETRLQKFTASTKRMADGIKQFATAVSLTLGPLFGFLGNQAAAFEQQMSFVRSILQDATEKEFSQLTNIVKDLGATTSKTAVEVGKAAEFLARAGFNATEVMDALDDVIRASEADAIDLASAANIVANNVRAFGLEAKQAGMVADVLAQTSAKTNTNMIGLAEALKFTAPVANQLGQNIQDTSWALGILANAGLQGTVGGTALKNMLIQLTNPTKAVRQQMASLGIKVQDLNGNMLPLPQLIEEIAKATTRMNGNMEISAFMSETFGIRGQAAASNLVNAFQSMNEMVDDGAGNMITKMEHLRRSIHASDGAAKRMAEIRLENFRGALILLQSAIEGLGIELFTDSIQFVTPLIKEVGKAIGFMAQGARELDKAIKGVRPELTDTGTLSESMAYAFWQVGAGLRMAGREVQFMISKLGPFKRMLMESFGESTGLAQISRFVGVVLVLTTALSVLGVTGAFVLGPFVSGLAMIGSGLVGVLHAGLPVLAWIGFFLAAINQTRAKGQSFGQRMEEIWIRITRFTKTFYDTFMIGWPVMVEAFGELKAAAMELFAVFQPVFDEIDALFVDTTEEGEILGRSFATVVYNMTKAATWLIKNVIKPLAAFVADSFVRPFILGIRQIVGGFIEMLKGGDHLRTGLIRMLKGLVNVLLNTVLRPVKLAIIALMEGIALVSEYAGYKNTARGAREYIRQIEARPGTFLGESAEDIEATRQRRRSSVAAQQALESQRRLQESLVEDPNITVKPADARVQADISTSLDVDGKTIATTTEQVKFELAERGGFGLTPWQQTAIIAEGGLPGGM